MELAKQYLRRKEWSMGNGQCPECCGLKPGLWDEHPDPKGHKAKCTLAYALEAVGASVQYAAAPEPEVMTLEEVAEHIRRLIAGRVQNSMVDLADWHRAITAHLEGEPKGLTEWEIGRLYFAVDALEGRGNTIWAQQVRDIAQRHTKGGKQA